MPAPKEPGVIDAEVDRLSELVNIGAGHAASAFSQLTGQTITMEVPRVRILGSETSVDDRENPWCSGVIFEFDGCLGGLVAILFRSSMCKAVVRELVGSDEELVPQETVESALMEVGNVLASHVASAIADTLGARLLPSIPTLSLDHAEEDLERLIAAREAVGGLRIECELADRKGELGGLVVLIPDRSAGG